MILLLLSMLVGSDKENYGFPQNVPIEKQPCNNYLAIAMYYNIYWYSAINPKNVFKRIKHMLELYRNLKFP